MKNSCGVFNEYVLDFAEKNRFGVLPFDGWLGAGNMMGKYFS
jgi:hypothetical protein